MMFFVMLAKLAIGLVLWTAAAWLGIVIVRCIPEGRIKRLLTRPIGAERTRTGRRRATKQQP